MFSVRVRSGARPGTNSHAWARTGASPLVFIALVHQHTLTRTLSPFVYLKFSPPAQQMESNAIFSSSISQTQSSSVPRVKTIKSAQ